jgi:hypothetical protein
MLGKVHQNFTINGKDLQTLPVECKHKYFGDKHDATDTTNTTSHVSANAQQPAC